MNQQLVRSAILLATLLCLTLVSAQAFNGTHPYIQVRIDWPDENQRAALAAIDDLDPMKMVPGEEIILVSTEDQIARLEALGFTVEIQIADMEAYYADQREGYRNFGDLFTYSETNALLDEFHALYPEITTARISIGTTHEGNQIWAFKVSDNPEIDEDEPEVCFDAMHHAREPIGANVLIETIRYLCENYGSDPEATYLVDNRETWFVPVVNVDGYLYNELNSPGGGGMWRKNRRPPTGGCWGVDPNRNYPYEWGGIGSSSDPCSDTYRGPEPASEPCIQAMIDFYSAHEFVTHDTYHSVVGIILIPWAFTNQHTPHDAQFRAMAAGMSELSGYNYGQPGEILYNCSGVTFDWTYAELGMFSVCTEVDGSGFWPNDNEIPGLVAENVPKNLYVMKVAGCYLDMTDALLSGGNGDAKPDPGETLDLTVTLANEGVIAAAENVSLTLSTADPYVLLHEASSALGQIPAGGEGSNAASPFSFSVDEACPPGHLLEVTIEVGADGFSMSFTREWLVGDLPVLFADDMEGGVGGWAHEIGSSGFTDQWHQSTQRNNTPGGAVSWKFGDTGTGEYADHADGRLVTPPLELGSMTLITFWHWMDAEESSAYQGRAYDGGLIEISVDGGAWEQIAPQAGYTHTIRESSQPGPFAADTPVFSGSFTWREDSILLVDMAGEVQIGFRFGSDGNSGGEGWYVDDLTAAGITTDNQAPGAPALISPAPGETVGAAPTLNVANAVDPDPGDELTYGFRVFDDQLQTVLVASVDGVPEGPAATAWVVSPPLADGTYYWDAYAFDGIERGPCMTAGYFHVVGSGQSVDRGPMAGGLRLLGAVPNPAPGSLTLSFQLAQGGRVQGGVFDLQGRRLRSLDGRYPAGQGNLHWDGRDDLGRDLPAGVYLFTLQAGDETRRGRLMLVR